MRGFNVTFERFHPHEEGEDISEADERGVAIEDATLREALSHCADLAIWARATEADCYPIRRPRSFYFHEYNTGTRESIEQGIREDRALHLPEAVTPASRRRITRLLGLQTG